MSWNRRIPSKIAYLREIHQYFSHFVTTFTAPDVDDDIGVGVLGKGLGNHSLSTAESTGNGGGTTLHTTKEMIRVIGKNGLRKERIQNALTSEQREIGSNLFGDRARSTDRPDLQHGVFEGLSLELDFQNGIL